MPAIIERNPETVPSSATRRNPELKTCPLCGAALENPVECSRCDWHAGYGQVALNVNTPRDKIAAILTFVWPGLGHVYKGHLVLGGFLAVLAFGFLLWSITFLMFFGPAILPVYWVGVAIDAYFRKDLKAPGAVRPPVS